MKKLYCAIAVVVTFTVTCTMAFAGGSDPEPPGRPSSGYGSTDNYICNGYTRHTFGDIDDGTRCSYYVPDTLISNPAPVIIEMHGVFLIGPEIYQGNIDHWTRQGYIVIHPQFNKDILSGFSDTDQYDHLDRGITAVNEALSRLGGIADTSQIYIYGHSEGALLALGWEAAGGPPAVARVLAAVNTDPNTGGGMQPDINVIDFISDASAITGPVIILGGNQDDIAPLNQQIDAYNALTNASSRRLYYMHGDWEGDPNLDADHMAPCTDMGLLSSGLLALLGMGDIEYDALDYRYYQATMDAVLDGQTSMTFNMGTWSDGTPVNVPEEIFP